ncbi:DNA repair protein RadA [Chrysiogenes arsenatis]|uniref:DNA repair protein RadA n=1 Tax=Chrysiogenes arsenatis TaxID=309797 RepID=UPI00041D5AC8|nr:DNA repair protein RadA [Chrysiogenes arsenatis]
MAKPTTVHTCAQCGATFPRWNGKCTECGAWGSISEEKTVTLPPRTKSTVGIAAATLDRLQDVVVENAPRQATRIPEFDRVLGGGIVPGSLILIGGDPGIGKSTLTMQCAGTIAKQGKKVLYISGEESPHQLKLRADRLGVLHPEIYVCATNSFEEAAQLVEQLRPHLLIIDSIQTIATQELESAAGTVSQVRHCAALLMALAKGKGIATILIGHVTKEGSLAGPRVLEHLVDVVLTFEGDRSHTFRLLRGTKNRFGSTNEVGVFQMEATGLTSVPNPSELLLAEKPANTPGSVATATIEGTRPLLVEVQALVSESFFGNPVRSALGLEHARVSMILAVLEKRFGLHIGAQDIYTNIVGGMKITETAADLAIAVALISSFRNRPIGHGVIVCGEIGLSGEIRSVAHADQRINEGRKLGFRRFIIPKNNAKKIAPSPEKREEEILGVASLDEVMESLF